MVLNHGPEEPPRGDVIAERLRREEIRFRLLTMQGRESRRQRPRHLSGNTLTTDQSIGETDETQHLHKGLRLWSDAKYHSRFHSQTLVRSVSLTINP